MARVAGKGFAINLVFAGAVQVLLMAQNVVVPRLLGPENIGVFALVLAVIGVGQQLKRLNVDEKLVQDRDTDLPLAYSNAFTLELILAIGLFLTTVAAAPVIARLLDRPEMTWLIVVLGLTIFTDALVGLPSAIYLRELRYFAQNVVQTAGTVVGVLVTIGLAAAGAGVWSLAFGSLAAMSVSAVALIVTMPYAPRLRLDRAIVREYLRYGWPLWTAGILGAVSTWGGTIVITSALGVVALGYFTLAEGIGRRVFQLDAILAKTVFPVLARAQRDEEGQRRAFETVTRVSLIWAATLGFGLAVFAEELVALLLGEAWLPAVFLLRMQGLAVTVGSVGFSWDVFFRARGESRPTLVHHVIAEGWVFVVLLPAVVLFGLEGAGWALLGLGFFALAVRQVLLQRIFPGINLVVVAWRELLATGAAALASWGLAVAIGRADSIAELALQGSAFLIFVAIGIGLLDGAYLRSLLRSLRTAGGEAAMPALAPTIEADLSSGMGPEVVGNIATDLAMPSDGPASAASGPHSARIMRRIPTPGQHPLYATPGRHGVAWVTMRDSSLLGLFAPDTDRWDTWRLPIWPHVACVDDRGRAWVALTLSSSVVCVDPASSVAIRHRLTRSRELLVAGWADGSCWVADAARRVLVEVNDSSNTERAFPDGVLRPDFVVPGLHRDLWVTDTANPALIHVAADRSMRLVDVPDGTRVGAIDGGTLWVGHTATAAATALDATSGAVLRTVTLPDIPFGVSVGPRQELWFAFPFLDAVGHLDAGGATTLVPIGDHTAPTSVAWLGDTGYVTCSGTSELVAIQ